MRLPLWSRVSESRIDADNTDYADFLDIFPSLPSFNSDKYSPINFSIYTYLAILAEQVKLAEKNVKKPLKKPVFTWFSLARKLL